MKFSFKNALFDLQDICYFNFECLHPWGIIVDYGNTFSNVGYVVCGLFFICIVNRRSQRHQRFLQLAEQRSSYLKQSPSQHGMVKVWYVKVILGNNELYPELKDGSRVFLESLSCLVCKWLRIIKGRVRSDQSCLKVVCEIMSYIRN